MHPSTLSPPLCVRGATPSSLPSKQVDEIFRRAAEAANAARIPLAKMAVEETRMGVVEDKVVKNHFASEFIYNKYKNYKSCGVIEDDPMGGIQKVAEPMGVIAGERAWAWAVARVWGWGWGAGAGAWCLSERTPRRRGLVVWGAVSPRAGRPLLDLPCSAMHGAPARHACMHAFPHNNQGLLGCILSTVSTPLPPVPPARHHPAPGIVPTTNPTSTAIFKALLALKTRNGLVLCPHPRAARSTIAAAKIVADAAVKAGAPDGIISWIDTPSLPVSQALMQAPEISLILATGGPAMVRAAYSSGHPSLGVGAGNTPALIDETASIPMAVSSILLSKTFDNGVICASEQSVVVADKVYDLVREEFVRRGAYFLTEEDKKKVGGICCLVCKRG